jgi:septal ring factor EnvC (AmiA/AmiB activator)
MVLPLIGGHWRDKRVIGGTEFIEMVVRFFLFLCVIGWAFAAAEADSDVSDRSKELKDIQKEITRRKQSLDSLKNAEKKITKQVADIEGKISSDKKVVSRLSVELRDLQKMVQNLNDQITIGQSQYAQSQDRLTNSIKNFYLASRESKRPLFGEPNSELETQRKLNYLTTVTQFASANVEQSQSLLQATTEELKSATGRSQKVSKLKQQKESAVALAGAKKATQEKNLKQLRRKHSLTADELVTLEQAAKAMEDIIARLEAARKEAERSHEQPKVQVPSGSLASFKGQLPSPCKGEIIIPYGARVDPQTKLKAFSPGISIASNPGGQVRAVADGVVVYVSDLRGYGRFVIVQHDKTHYATYAGLGNTYVSTNQEISAGDAVGAAGNDGVVRFELRNGKQTLDPVEWLRLDSF